MMRDADRKYYSDQDEGWCGWCSESLPVYRHWRTRFCNKTCGNAYFNSLVVDARREVRSKLKCLRCGDPIPNATRGDQKYCSRRCERQR